MSVPDSLLTMRQYTDAMLVIGADHVATVAGGNAILLALIPVLWILGVILLVARKFHSR